MPVDDAALAAFPDAGTPAEDAGAMLALLRRAAARPASQQATLVAHAVVVQAQSHFIRDFRSVVGMTPTAYAPVRTASPP